MPTIDLGLTQAFWEGGPDSGLRLLATMAYPSDQAKRHELIASAFAGELARTERLRAGNLSPGVAKLLDATDRQATDGIAEEGGFAALHRSADPVSAERGLARRCISGELAGTQLLFLMTPPYRVRGRDGPTAEQGVFLISRLNALKNRGNVGAPRLPTSRSKIKDAWAEFLSVSHLWAAIRLLMRKRDPQPLSVGRLLGASEVVLERAVVGGHLKADQLWRPPRELCLPEADLPFVQPLSDQARKILLEYRNPKKYQSKTDLD